MRSVPIGAGHTSPCLPREFSFSSTGKMPKGITVHHQLKIELVVGEDVFHKDTGKLVERKTMQTNDMSCGSFECL
ncbi:hypothetical protein PDIG_15290 [Penicillium digitatum PHI26]|uniref:Uncharacterized protein n=2 Tax=Penicillium digitatum TaxID=36651 RepID=K9G672_PEND2|nr:hypothetical protein PDIP_30810 [Penicillium digitatum Pd1]EKV17405.1 hypothetical protein PDIG_15290 [Penicillium digitatum PHI26]EKV17668.1 hypothetical protein PDIP_30810 [Penicillium digitatum Pd1]